MLVSMSTAIVLAMHGVPPNDFPPHELRELMTIHAKLQHHDHAAGGPGHEELHARHDEIHDKMREWPRTPENDPYHAASHWLAGHLRDETGHPVFVGFNEFCGPSVEEAIDLAVDTGAGKVLVLTTMMTSGGSHAERDIPEAIARAQTRHPRVRVDYAWPYDLPDVARFLSHHIRKFEALRD